MEWHRRDARHIAHARIDIEYSNKMSATGLPKFEELLEAGDSEKSIHDTHFLVETAREQADCATDSVGFKDTRADRETEAEEVHLAATAQTPAAATQDRGSSLSGATETDGPNPVETESAASSKEVQLTSELVL